MYVLRILQAGETPLHVAAAHDYTRMTEVLVKAGADLNIANRVRYYHCYMNATPLLAEVS